MRHTQTLTDASAPSEYARLAPLSAPPSFTCTRRDGRFGAALVLVSGDLDLAATHQLEQALREAEIDARLVVLDLRDLAFMDCVGMHVIVDADERARQAGGRLIVVRGPASVDRMFTLTRTSDVIEFSDMTDANPSQGDICGR